MMVAMSIIAIGLALGYLLWRTFSLVVHFTVVPQYDDHNLWLMITITSPNGPMSVMRIEARNRTTESARCQRSLYGHKFPFPLQAGQILPGKVVLANSPDQFGMWTRGKTRISVYDVKHHRPSRKTVRIRIPNMIGLPVLA